MNYWEKLIVSLRKMKGTSLTSEELEQLRTWFKNALCGYVQPLKEVFDFVE